MKILVILLSLAWWLVPTSVYALVACTTTTANLLQPTVQAAVDAAVNGDVVCLPAGSANWGNGATTSGVTVPNTKGVVIQGAGEGLTTLTNTHASFGLLQLTTSAGKAVSEISHLTIDGSTVAKSGLTGWVLTNGTGANAFRVHHVTFNGLRNRAILPWSTASGLIDHVTFNAPNNLTVQGLAVIGAGPESDAGYLVAQTLGGVNAVYVENNTFNFDFVNDGAFDAYGGARVVFRYNTVNGTGVGWHGADSGGYRGVNTVEVYRNTFSKVTSGSTRLVFIRSGSGPIFDNTYTGNYSSLEIAVYRSRPNSFAVKYGQCDGLSAWDGNVGTGALPTGNPGWPCLDQTGYLFTNASGGSYTSTPLYAWKNTLSSVEVNPRASLSEATGTATYVISDREWYHFSSAVGTPQTTGVRVGTLASRPAGCTTGVAYWATDQGAWNTFDNTNGVLYKCTATNTWTSYYTPYTYPHPLQGVSTPPAPTIVGTFRAAIFGGASFGVLVWTQNTDADFAGFYVYRSTVSGDYTGANAIVATITKASAAASRSPITQYVDTRMKPGVTYYYKVAAFSTQNTIGELSTEITVVK